MYDVIEQTPIIETRRLVLRAPRSSDAGRIALLAGDMDVARMTTAMPHPYARHHAEAFLAQVETLDPAREIVFAVELEDQGLIGVLGFHADRRAGRHPGRAVHLCRAGDRLLAGPALLGPRAGDRGGDRRAGLGEEDLAQADGGVRPLRRQSGVRPGAGKGRLPLYRRGPAAPLRRSRRGRRHPDDGLARVILSNTLGRGASPNKGRTSTPPPSSSTTMP